ncbi:MAG: hypothetical protein H0X53_08235 [Sphingomonas sp.]|nr:hypothetical protein [Sphingomonas sp.]
MTETRGDRRAETARQNDDSDIIEAATDDTAAAAAGQQGRSGGNLQRDVGTQSEHERVSDPEANEGVTKEDDIAHGQRVQAPKPATHVVTER